jgi:hypothetical protein
MLQRLTFTAHFCHRKRRIKIIKPHRLRYARSLIESLPGRNRIVVESRNSSSNKGTVIVIIAGFRRGADALKVGLSINQAVCPPGTFGPTLLRMFEAESSAEILPQPAYCSRQPHEWHAPQNSTSSRGYNQFSLTGSPRKTIVPVMPTQPAHNNSGLNDVDIMASGLASEH